MKYNNYKSYSEEITNRTVKVLSSLWGVLDAYRHDMVLVGGLVPRFICSVGADANILRPVTLDLDLGISIALDGGMSSIDWKLKSLGYKEDETEGSRFIATIDGVAIPIDFLTEYSKSASAIEIAGIKASNLPGIVRALETSRKIMFEVTDEIGDIKNVPLRVCEAGAYMTLKLRAFLHRRQPKDAYDLYYVMRYYDGGNKDGLNIFQQFALEKEEGNTAMKDALQSLETYFKEEGSEGCMKAAEFVESFVPDEIILEIKQTLVTASRALLNKVL